jgi:hypothetical protein
MAPNIEAIDWMIDQVGHRAHDYIMEEPAIVVSPSDPRFEPWRDRLSRRQKEIKEPQLSCGTALCLAGWALAHKFRLTVSRDLDMALFDGLWNRIRDEATEYLGLPIRWGDAVFTLDGWPAEIRAEYHYASTDQGRANAGIKVLELIKQPDVITPYGWWPDYGPAVKPLPHDFVDNDDVPF